MQVATPVSEKTDFKSRSISRNRVGQSKSFQMYKAKYTTKRKKWTNPQLEALL